MTTIPGILITGRRTGLRSPALYAFSGILGKGVTVLMLLYLANTLTEAGLGIFSLFICGVVLLMPFISMGIPQSIKEAYFKKDKKEFSVLFSSTLIMPAVVTLLITGVVFIFRQQLQQHYHLNTAVFIFIPLAAFCNFLNRHLTNMVRAGNDPVKYVFITIGRLLAIITLVVFFTGALEWGWVGSIAGISISYSMVAVYAFFYFREEGFININLSKKYISGELKKYVPAVIIPAGVFFIVPSAVYFIEYFTNDLAAAGIFGITAALSSVIIMIGITLARYNHAKVSSLFSAKQADRMAIRWHLLFYTGMLLLSTGIVVIALPIVCSVLLKQSYHTGLSYYIFICAGYFFWGVSYFLDTFMLRENNKRKLLYSALFPVLFCFLSHSIFINQWGAYGAAVSVCVAYFTVLLVTIFSVRKQLTQLLSNKLSKAFL